MQLLSVEIELKYNLSRAEANKHEYETFWLGAARQTGPCTWLITGKPLNYTAWSRNEPEKNVKRNCLANYFIDSFAFSWFNFECGHLFQFICEESDNGQA